MNKLDEVLGDKDAIKKLFLDLVGHGSLDISYDLDALSASDKAKLVGRNELTLELRQKIEAL